MLTSCDNINMPSLHLVYALFLSSIFFPNNLATKSILSYTNVTIFIMKYLLSRVLSLLSKQPLLWYEWIIMLWVKPTYQNNFSTKSMFNVYMFTFEGLRGNFVCKYVMVYVIEGKEKLISNSVLFFQPFQILVKFLMVIMKTNKIRYTRDTINIRQEKYCFQRRLFVFLTPRHLYLS